MAWCYELRLSSTIVLKVTWFSAFMHATFGFLKVTIFAGGFLDGWLGLVMCWNHYIYTLMKYAKLHELYRKG